MQKIIKDAQIANDSWHLLAIDTSLENIANCDDVIVPFALWLEHKQLLQKRDGQTAVWLDSSQEIEDLANDLATLPLIALEFPAFTDGRHYSTARILRDRYQYKGEIRAIGDVLKDQLFAMQRCGFNAFAVKADKDIENALLSLNDFTETYQGATDQPLPLFRRR